MKKILIWNSFPLKERNGGPPTYLFNLKKGLENINNNKIIITFLTDLIPSNLVDNKDFSRFHKLASILPQSVYSNLRILNLVRCNTNYISPLTIDEVNKFDAIHFHLLTDIYKNRRLLNNYRGQIFVTSHSPKPAWKETIEDKFSLNISRAYYPLQKKLENIDLFGFRKADKIIFPCKEAIEPYSLGWKKFEDEIITSNKFEYIPSGINKVKYQKDKEQVRQELSIPRDAIVFSYIGRHSSIKGYDLLRELGKDLLEKYPNVYFLVAGTESPLKGIKHPKWIEVGWTMDPHSYVNASDIFVLPNRQTYFDLVLLEILSLGKPILLSETGGNKYFKKFNSDGLVFFRGNDINSLKSTAENMIAQKNTFPRLGQKNQELFKAHFDLNTFAIEYVNLYKNICN